jgi:hypothetical protein
MSGDRPQQRIIRSDDSCITGHGALNHAIKKVLAQKIEIRAVIGFAAEGARLFNRSAFHAENRNAPRTNGDNHKNFGL